MIKYATEQRKILLSLFEKNKHETFSANDILSEIPDAGISLSAIYRNLKAMENEGIICKSNDPKQSEAHYHYINPEGCVGIIHLKCEVCNKIFHLNSSISNMLFDFSKEEIGFSLNKSGAFLYGICNNCSQINSK